MGLIDFFTQDVSSPEKQYQLAQVQDAFSNLRDNGGGPRQAPGALQVLQQHRDRQIQQQQQAHQQAALRQAAQGMGLMQPQSGEGPLTAPQALAAAGLYEKAIAAAGQRKPNGSKELQLFRERQSNPEFAAYLDSQRKPDTAWRDATPQELARYGATAGQVNEATGKFAPINPATGMRMESDGDGGFTFSQGPGALSRRTQGDIESKEFEARDSLARLDTIQTNLNSPDFMESLTAAGRLKQWGLEWADTLDPSLLGPEQQEYLSSVATARGDVLENVNFTIKAITGAAMTESEAKRIGATLPGINDSPTVFKAKLKRSLDRTRAAVARYHLWGQGGGRGKPEEYDTLPNVEKKMMDRAAELKKAVESGEMDATAASVQFRLEFGT